MSMFTHWCPPRLPAHPHPAADFDDVWRNLGRRPIWRELDAVPEIRFDISEDETNDCVEAEIPGAEKRDIELSIDGNQVSIGVETKRQARSPAGEKDLYSERSYGKARRFFMLPTDVDAAKAEARYENGALAIALPKKVSSRDA